MNDQKLKAATAWSAASGLMVLFIAGCGHPGPKLVQVSGKIVLQDRPLACGVVIFQPLADSKVSHQRPSIGVIESDGTYRVSTFAAYDGAVPGEYLVAVGGGLENDKNRSQSIDSIGVTTVTAPGGSAIPRKYLLPQTSGLKATIPADADEIELNFTLDAS